MICPVSGLPPLKDQGLEVRRKERQSEPTVAIRDQWAHRLTSLFLEEPPGVDDVSHHLAEPRALTLATYQALDGARRANSVERLAQDLNAAGPITLVLDEAHHLRREWWNSIEQLVGSLADDRIVALTATPPCDTSFAEWTRYESVCGPIDLEIGIPELVRNGDLCPHQDQAWPWVKNITRTMTLTRSATPSSAPPPRADRRNAIQRSRVMARLQGSA